MSNASETNPKRLILASTSPYRAQLLERLGLAFEQRSPEVDETRLRDEPPRHYVDRLARQKALAGTTGTSPDLVLGGDQVCLDGEQLIGKPGTIESARAQLRQASGRPMTFLTAVALYNSVSDATEGVVVSDEVVFRDLEEAEIQRYVATDQPFDCAGAFRAEGLGITLFEAVHSSDPTSLVGLPLITTARLLRDQGWPLP